MRRSKTNAWNIDILLTVVVAGVFGFIGGAFAANLLVGFANDRLEKAVAGAFTGAMAGLLGGSLGGDLSGQEAKGSGRSVYGLCAGGMVGMLAAAQSDHLLGTLRLLTFDLIH